MVNGIDPSDATDGTSRGVSAVTDVISDVKDSLGNHDNSFIGSNGISTADDGDGGT